MCELVLDDLTFPLVAAGEETGAAAGRWRGEVRPPQQEGRQQARWGHTRSEWHCCLVEAVGVQRGEMALGWGMGGHRERGCRFL